jgi:hypothetical protein
MGRLPSAWGCVPTGGGPHAYDDWGEIPRTEEDGEVGLCTCPAVTRMISVAEAEMVTLSPASARRYDRAVAAPGSAMRRCRTTCPVRCLQPRAAGSAVEWALADGRFVPSE